MYKAPKKITSHPGVKSCESAPDQGAPDYRHYVELKDGWAMPAGHRNEGGMSTFCQSAEEFLAMAPVQKEAETKPTKKTSSRPRTPFVKTTEPIRKAHQPRTVELTKGTRVNKHHNDDGSITLYAAGVKIFRSASDEDIENGAVAEDYDADEAIEKFLNKWFGKNGQWLFGKETYGNNWKNKKRAEAEATAD